ncbi:MAG: GNAT family N-acetyltransferase [Aestuariibaculum sp.]
MLHIKVKSFLEIKTQELYNILQLRSEVFVVEQNCVYQDIDGKDKKALHVLVYKNDKLVGYTRLFKPGDYFDLASIGRVVVVEHERKNKYGYMLMETSINAIRKYFKVSKIKISAQEHLKHFYNNCGFIEYGKPYLEDGIPHIMMLWLIKTKSS